VSGSLLWAQGWATPENLGYVVIKVLAVAGGVLVGAVVSGLLLQLLVRLTTTARPPRWALRVVRVLGGVILGWLVFLFVFGYSGGTGGGFFGGGGPGTGKGGGAGTTAKTETTGKETVQSTEREKASKGSSLRVEVLVDPRSNAPGFRVEGRQGLLSLAELQSLVKHRQQEGPGVKRLEIVLYRNSPDRDSGPVKELLTWCNREGLETSIDTPAVDAP
jgi:hypothetical protein